MILENYQNGIFEGDPVLGQPTCPKNKAGELFADVFFFRFSPKHRVPIFTELNVLFFVYSGSIFERYKIGIDNYKMSTTSVSAYLDQNISGVKKLFIIVLLNTQSYVFQQNLPKLAVSH